MSRVQITTLAIVSALVLLLPACGGGSDGGFAGANNPLRVTSSSIPPSMSGEAFSYVIDLAGGCGGPYVMRVIDGRLPSGLELVNETHSIEGYLLEDGNFTFRVQIEDSGCTPFQSTVQAFSMSVGVGEIVVVDVLQDGNPSLIPADSEPKYAGYPALPEVVYNEFTSLQFVVAGGVGPYRMNVYDDPSVPNDGPLPLGVTIPAGSASIVGSPVQVGPGGEPFLVSYRITDSVGNQGFFTGYWLIETPPIIVATPALGGGVCGDAYSEQFFVAEGVPPFTHDLVADGLPADYTSDSSSNPNLDPDADVIYRTAEGLPPEVNPPGALVQIDATVYPPAAAPGPNYDQSYPGAPPEGIYLIEGSGAYTGVPRRSGTFSINYHVRSALVPNNFGQHAWKSFTFSFASAGSLAQNPAYTEQGVFLSDPNSSIPELEVGAPYNPDGGDSRGLDLLATGGVPNDGFTDAPLASQRELDPTEEEGSYDWTVDYDPNNIGTPPIPGSICYPAGVFGTDDPNALQSQQFQDIAFTVSDAELPVGNTATEQVRIAVGPDVVIITESDQSFTGGTATYISTIDTAMADQSMRLKVLLPLSTGATKRPLSNSTDLAAGTSIPTEAEGASLRDLLGGGSDEDYGVDLLRVSINPAGWWEDSFNFNPKGAKGLEHADANKVYNYRPDAFAYKYDYKYSNSSGYSSVSNYEYGTSTEVSAVRLPDYEGDEVTHDPSSGVYTNGGKLYAFDSADYFGVFVLRSDSKFYVPVAFDKSGDSGWKSFGDNWLDDYPDSEKEFQLPMWKIPQMAVTPDGRFAVMKVSTATHGWFESTPYTGSTSTTRNFLNATADETGMVIFSLTGEKPSAWGGKSYTIIGTGANGSADTGTTTGQIMWAPSMVMSNSHLYYVCGTTPSTAYGSAYYWYTEGSSWRYNWIYRYEILGGGSAGELLTTSDSDWTNSAGISNALQIPFQRASDDIAYTRPYSYGYSSGTYWYQGQYEYKNTNSYYGNGFQDSYNVHEGSKAPMPFRVSADGNTVVVLASPASTSSSSSEHWNYHVWVDEDGGDLTKISTEARKFVGGGSRGSALRMNAGYYSYANYSAQIGMYQGPTTHLEVSDDGTKVAAVCNRAEGTYSYSSASQWASNREDIIAWVKDGTDWDEIQITGTESLDDPAFSDPVTWRFGSLVFTKEGDGLIFWGGACGYYPVNPSYSSYAYSSYFTGSMYAYDFEGSRAGSVINILDSSDGGLTEYSKGDEFDADNPVLPSYATSNFLTNRVFGAIIPMGGFMSPNREFYYIMNCGGLDTGKSEAARIVGFNVRSLDESQSAGKGRTDGYGFALDWPTRRGFAPTYYYYGYYGIRYSEYGPANQYGTLQVMTRNGRVFFGAHYQPNGPSYSSSSGPSVPTYYYGGGARAGQIGFFDSNVGGDAAIISSLSPDTSSTNRSIKYLEPTDDGSAVAFLYTKQAGSYLSATYPMDQTQEQLGYLGGITVSGTGVVDSTLLYEVADVTGSGKVARMGTGMTNDSLGRRIVYSAGTGDENKKYLYITTPNPDGSQSPRKIEFSDDPHRYNVLHAGR